MLSRFHLIPERYGQTDGQTDRQTNRRTDIFAISISRVSMLTRDKNSDFLPISRYCRVVNAATVRWYKHSAARPWQVGDTHS